MAPGVGKDRPDLQEGAAEAESGRDGAIGYLSRTAAPKRLPSAEGLEIIPRRRLLPRKPLQEIDMPAVLAPSPNCV